MAEAVDPEYAKFQQQLDKWLEQKAGISKSLIESLEQDSDWAFVIKIHGIMEVALNHLIRSILTAPKLEPVIAHLETSHDRRGKIAFIKALDLLPEKACLFVKLLSKLRSDAVHKVTNFDLNLIEYLHGLDKPLQHNWKIAITWWISEPIDQKRQDNWLELFPRTGIQAACWFIVMKSFANSTYVERFLEALRGQADEKSSRPSESIPKE
jgi:hypothetical protein